MVALWMGLNAKLNRGREICSWWWFCLIPGNQCKGVVSHLSLPQKNKPMPVGEEEGHVMPADRESFMYTSIASLYGQYWFYSRQVSSSREEIYGVIVRPMWGQRKAALFAEHFPQIGIFCKNSGQVCRLRDGWECSDLYWMKCCLQAWGIAGWTPADCFSSRPVKVGVCIAIATGNKRRGIRDCCFMHRVSWSYILVKGVKGKAVGLTQTPSTTFPFWSKGAGGKKIDCNINIYLLSSSRDAWWERGRLSSATWAPLSGWFKQQDLGLHNLPFIGSLCSLRNAPWSNSSSHPESTARVLNSTEYSVTLWRPWWRTSRHLVAFFPWTMWSKTFSFLRLKLVRVEQIVNWFSYKAVAHESAFSFNNPMM